MFNKNSRVVVSRPRSFQGGTSTLTGCTGTVVAARERSCDVLLDGHDGAMWFSHIELDELPEE